MKEITPSQQPASSEFSLLFIGVVGNLYDKSEILKEKTAINGSRAYINRFIEKVENYDDTDLRNLADQASSILKKVQTYIASMPDKSFTDQEPNRLPLYTSQLYQIEQEFIKHKNPAWHDKVSQLHEIFQIPYDSYGVRSKMDMHNRRVLTKTGIDEKMDQYYGKAQEAFRSEREGTVFNEFVKNGVELHISILGLVAKGDINLASLNNNDSLQFQEQLESFEKLVRNHTGLNEAQKPDIGQMVSSEYIKPDICLITDSEYISCSERAKSFLPRIKELLTQLNALPAKQHKQY